MSLSNEAAVAPSGEAERLAALRRSIAEGSDDPAAHAQLGGMLAQSGDLAGAEQALRKATELAPAAAGYRVSLARVLNRTGRPEAAIGLLREVVAAHRKDPAAHALLGHILVETGDPPDAEAALRQAIELNPKALGVRKTLAGMLGRQGRDGEISDVLRPAIDSGTADLSTCTQLAQVLSRRQDFAGAEYAIRHAIELAPNEARFRLELAELLHRQERRPEAVAVLRELAAASADDASFQHRIGRLLNRSDDREGSERVIRSAIELEPGNEEFRITLASQFLMWKRRADALGLLWDLRADGITRAKVSELWNRTIERLEGVAAAEDVLRDELQARPADPGLRGALAELLCEQGRIDEATNILLSHPSDAPEDARILAMLQRLRPARGNGSVPPEPEATAEFAPPPVSPAPESVETVRVPLHRTRAADRPVRSGLLGWFATIIGKSSRQPR